MGVGVKGATEQIGRKLQRILKTRHQSYVLQVDLSIAFNSVERTAIQNNLKTLAPELQSWFEFTHTEPSPIFCDKEILFSSQGTKQGDPLDPAFFALAIHPILELTAGTPGIDWDVFLLRRRSARWRSRSIAADTGAAYYSVWNGGIKSKYD